MSYDPVRMLVTRYIQQQRTTWKWWQLGKRKHFKWVNGEWVLKEEGVAEDNAEKENIEGVPEVPEERYTQEGRE